jgi:hypothetical protein
MLDFLNWSLINEKDLVSCLSAASDLAMTSLYPAEPQRWLRTLRSQFIQVGLSTPSSQSESKIREQQMNPHKQLREQERINRRSLDSDSRFLWKVMNSLSSNCRTCIVPIVKPWLIRLQYNQPSRPTRSQYISVACIPSPKGSRTASPQSSHCAIGRTYSWTNSTIAIPTKCNNSNLSG